MLDGALEWAGVMIDRFAAKGDTLMINTKPPKE
jgi:hypothetical protein